MSELEKAAQAVLDRWDSPAWDWVPHGPTAALMADLRDALAAHRQAEPVALTVVEIEQMNAQWNYEIHGDRTRYLVRMTEKAHGIGEKE
jgi:hypothetical protein